MTNANTLSLRSFDIPSIHKFTVGFDNIFDELHRATVQQANSAGNYPPYNVVKHDDDHFDIELAVAGFRQGDISITVEKNVLTIKGEQTQDLDKLDAPQPEYLHRGISARNFARTFTLAEHVEVLDASSEDGILTVKLERKVPDEQKPKSIAISYKK
jgi:molecular chaperone IbpA